MGGWRLLRIFIATVVVLAAIGNAYLAVLPILPASWSPYAAMVTVLAFYLWSEITNEVGRKESAAYRDHVKDLQGFAGEARLAAATGPAYVGAISLTGPMGKPFRKHFPDAGKVIDEWNDDVARDYNPAGDRFRAALNSEAHRVTGDYPSSALEALLHNISMGVAKVDELTWWVQETGQITVTWQGSWVIYRLPSTEKETEEFLLKVWDSICHVSALPEVAAWDARTRRKEELRPALLSALAEVEVTQDPPHRCKLCPR